MVKDYEIKRNYLSVPSGRLSRFMNFAGMSAGITGNILFSAANNFFSGKHSNFQDFINAIIWAALSSPDDGSFIPAIAAKPLYCDKPWFPEALLAIKMDPDW